MVSNWPPLCGGEEDEDRRGGWGGGVAGEAEWLDPRLLAWACFYACALVPPLHRYGRFRAKRPAVANAHPPPADSSEEPAQPSSEVLRSGLRHVKTSGHNSFITYLLLFT